MDRTQHTHCHFVAEETGGKSSLIQGRLPTSEGQNSLLVDVNDD